MNKGEENYIEINDSLLHYTKAGNGKEPLLLFHGFGQQGNAFHLLIQELAHAYTFYSFDLFFHGKSSWALAEEPLTKRHWKDFVQHLISQHSIERFSLAGFSIGGKFVLATLEAFPTKINNIFLMAPDGITISPWYKVATATALSRMVFRRIISHANYIVALAHFASTIRLADPSLVRFIEYQLASEEKRKKVYYSWIVFRRLSFNMRKIAALINLHSISVVVITGETDVIIRPHYAHRLLYHVKQYQLEVIPAGHYMMHYISSLIGLLRKKRNT